MHPATLTAASWFAQGNGAEEMSSSPSDYYARRAEQERAMAEAAKNPGAKQAHNTMARRYERIACGEPLKLSVVERD